MASTKISAYSNAHLKSMIDKSKIYSKLERAVIEFISTPAISAIPATGSAPAVPADTTAASAAYANMLTLAKSFTNEQLYLDDDSTPYSINELRLQVIHPSGTTLLDTYSVNNAYDNIDLPAPDFATSGRYLINNNQGNRLHIMTAFLTAKGISEFIHHSRTTNTIQVYNAQRLGPQHEPLAAVVISSKFYK